MGTAIGTLLYCLIPIVSTVVGGILALMALAKTAAALATIVPNSAARIVIAIVWVIIYLYLMIHGFMVPDATEIIAGILVFWIPAIILWAIAQNIQKNN